LEFVENALGARLRCNLTEFHFTTHRRGRLYSGCGGLVFGAHMRRLSVLVLAATAMNAMAFADTAPAGAAPLEAPAPPPSACAAAPEKPPLPEPKSARRKDMEGANAAFQAWQQEMLKVLDCRRTEFVAADAVRARRLNDYNAAVTDLKAFGQTWTSQAQAYEKANSSAR
jgi:hypothetical protein